MATIVGRDVVAAVASKYSERPYRPASFETHLFEVLSIRNHLRLDAPFADPLLLTTASGALVDLYNEKQANGISQREYDAGVSEIIGTIKFSNSEGLEKYRKIVQGILDDPGFRLHKHEALENAVRAIEDFVGMTSLQRSDAVGSLTAHDVEPLVRPAARMPLRR